MEIHEPLNTYAAAGTLFNDKLCHTIQHGGAYKISTFFTRNA